MMKASQEPLTDDTIMQVFRDLDLESPEKRETFQRLSPQTEDTSGPSEQVFIRIVSSTTPTQEPQNA